MLHFCTYFDQHYLARGLALYHSLCEHCPEFRLWILCMDDAAYRTLTELNLPEVYPIALEDFERDDGPLKIAKSNRSRVEYYFTCTPSLPLYVLNHDPEVNLITYIDADLFFFANPAPLFEEMGKGSVAIIGHRFPPKLKKWEIHGIYNVGWLSFRRDVNGLVCLQWWRDRCNEWCYDRVENERFADQKYLNDWPIRFNNVIVLEHKGANVAPWNVSNYHFGCENGKTVMVDDQPLIFFHFHALKQMSSWSYNPNWDSYGITPSQVLRKKIYSPYIKSLLDVTQRWLSSSQSRAIFDSIRGGENKREGSVSRIRHVMRKLKKLPPMGKTLVTRKYLFIISGHVF